MNYKLVGNPDLIIFFSVSVGSSVMTVSWAKKRMAEGSLGILLSAGCSS